MSEYMPLDCEQVLHDLFAWLDGDLTDERHRQVSAHLEVCRSCFSRADFETRLKQHLREVGRATVPPEAEQRLRSIVDRLPGP
ncbi:MAG: anti-sigma factor family protein [Longimicrobiales bacterium]